MKESFVAADVNFTSQGTPSLAWITECTFMPPLCHLYAAFLLPGIGMSADSLENHVGKQ